ncbi:uncharacterized protein BDW43DRAFT_302447 [Aspergillus alliaceus]|uniref:uncharacterized protein n=1 Tax=Petromyces alliaceus TaxID=209559 RepID=UPI0012A51071|nr:uncharacterized protein BDW43DRAFT_302447 [Aspergillus alliaceus]KAB8230336.1 hypothetical protein BDW43DRAFT_302447 [Aspergillus alliaceus]
MVLNTPSTKEILLQETEERLGPEALDTIDEASIISEPPPPGTGALTAIPVCITQKPTPKNLKREPAAIVVGPEFEVPRWKPEDAEYMASHMHKVAEEWNKGGVRVTFKDVPLTKDANFVQVYTYAFSPAYKRHMWSVFAHELGHVLGLGHEFALAPNELSVMNYRREPPMIQQSDIDGTKIFYNPPVGTILGKTPIVDYIPM